LFNVRVSAIAAAAAFILSLLIGLIGGAGFPAVALRALVFGVSFFGFSAVSDLLISRFLPELFGSEPPPVDDAEAADGERPGANVDLSVGDEEDAYPVFSRPVGSDAAASADALSFAEANAGEDSSELEEAGLDHVDEGGYTETARGSASPAAASSGMTASGVTATAAAKPPELIGDVDDLPDLEGLSDAFVSPIDIDDDVSGPAPVASSPRREASSERFDSKEMAMAIQTILKRDQKG
jgi:hypothetical protein